MISEGGFLSQVKKIKLKEIIVAHGNPSIPFLLKWLKLVIVVPKNASVKTSFKVSVAG